VRGKNDMMRFAFSGILNSLILLISNVVFIYLLNKGFKGWVISFFLAKIIASIYVSKVVSVHKYFSFSSISRSFINEAFTYCIPLLPNAIMWWIMNLSDRYIIAAFIGVGANGIYAVASKVPSILSILENVFFQSWQTSAINVVKEKDRDIFYSNVFNKYAVIMTIGVLSTLIVLKPIMVYITNIKTQPVLSPFLKALCK